MKILFFILMFGTCFSQDYNKAIDYYKAGKINSNELLNIINENINDNTSDLDILAQQYIVSQKDSFEVSVNFFPGVDVIVGGLIKTIKNENLRKVLGFFFPGKCNEDQLLKEVGAHHLNQIFIQNNIPVPEYVKKYLNE